MVDVSGHGGANLVVILLALTCIAGCGASSEPQAVSDDSGAITIETPGDWNSDGAEVDLPEIAEIELAAGSRNAALLAATDLESCNGTSFDVPCLDLIASVDIAAAVGTDFVERTFTLPEVFSALSDRHVLYEECADRGSALVEEDSDNPDAIVRALGAAHEGIVDIYTGCGDSGSTVYEFAAFARKQDVFVLGLLVAPIADGETTDPALTSLIESLDVRADLVPRSA
jgi:hypothetical protein